MAEADDADQADRTDQGHDTGEVADLIAALERHRGFLRQTLQGISDEQAGLRPTAGELCLGGLIKHVSATEAQWLGFMREGAPAFGPPMEAEVDWSDPQVQAGLQARAEQFRMLPGETVAGVLAGYAAVARATTDHLRTADLDRSHPLPVAPWFEPGASWSVRRAALHILAETSQHAGHADIVRESIDGVKTMG